MTAIDRAALIDAAAEAIGGTNLRLDRLNRNLARDAAAAALPEVVAAVLKPLRELHREQFQFCHDCDWDWPCPTVRMLDQIEADLAGVNHA